MTGSSDGKRALATLGRMVFFLSLVVGVTLAGVAVWGLLQVRDEGARTRMDTVLAGNQGVVGMTEGSERTVYIDGPSLDTAECTVTAPDGTVQTVEGFDPVGNDPRLGKQSIGDISAEVAGDYQVRCSGVEESWVSDEFDADRRSLVVIPALAGVFLVVGVLPIAVVSLVVWRTARRR